MAVCDFWAYIRQVTETASLFSLWSLILEAIGPVMNALKHRYGEPYGAEATSEEPEKWKPSWTGGLRAPGKASQD